VTAHALVGLAALNALFLVSGLAVLWLVRGLETWIDVARLAGLAYLVGVVVNSSLWVLLLIAGVPFSLFSVLAVPTGLALGSMFAARRRRRARPRGATLRAGTSLYVTAGGIAATGLLLEGFFRASRLAGLYEWDAWSFWIPKAQAIYLLGRLDVWFFTTLPGSSYPPLVPVLDAVAFQFMGAADVVTLHVQYWLLGVGFVWAVAGILAERVPPWILWPSVLLILIAPRIGPRVQVTEADLFLQYQFVVAALLVALWLSDRETWRLVLATALMCGMVLTKREGLLLAALLFAAAFLTSVRDWRRAVRPLAISVVVVALVAAPWRVWYIAHGVDAEGPAGGGLDPTENTARLWPSLRLALDVFFSSEYWSVIVPIAIGALVLAAVVRAWMLAAFAALLVTLVVLGGGWITWAIPELPITQEPGGNPIVRFMGASALLCGALAPLLLAAAWSAVASDDTEPGEA
jgi:hypothetical protein